MQSRFAMSRMSFLRFSSRVTFTLKKGLTLNWATISSSDSSQRSFQLCTELKLVFETREIGGGNSPDLFAREWLMNSADLLGFILKLKQNDPQNSILYLGTPIPSAFHFRSAALTLKRNSSINIGTTKNSFALVMYKAVRLLKSTLKYGMIGFVGASAVGFGYLQYINAQVGPLNLEKESAIRFYKEEHKMNDGDAQKTFYWVMFNVAKARILSYSTYSRYCNELRSKILNVSLDNYRKDCLFEEISKAGSPQSSRAHRNLFNKIANVRRTNSANIETRQYIIREIRRMQKEMNVGKLIGLKDEEKKDIDLLHNYLCSSGKVLRDPEILRYISKLPQIETKYPQDYLHKILVI